MDDFLKSLKEKEAQIVIQLEGSPLFIQLESLRKTITAFEGNGHTSTPIPESSQIVSTVHAVYDPKEMTWKARVRFVIKKLGVAGVGDIIAEIQRLEPNVHTKAFLDKRIGVTVSQMKEELGVKTVNKKRKYFIK